MGYRDEVALCEKTIWPKTEPGLSAWPTTAYILSDCVSLPLMLVLSSFSEGVVEGRRFGSRQIAEPR